MSLESSTKKFIYEEIKIYDDSKDNNTIYTLHKIVK